MDLQKAQFQHEFQLFLKEKFALDIDSASYYEYFSAIGALVKAYYATDLQKTTATKKKEKPKELYYFSIEFLPGRLLKSNLLNLGILDVVIEGLTELGIDFAKLMQIEPDMALGNGGLGRLASCFMDSAAYQTYPVNGNGIRYEHGLFRQRFIDSHQVELPERWLESGNVWEHRKENLAVSVAFGGEVSLETDDLGILKAVYKNQEKVKAVPYEVAMIGFKNGFINKMRLWKAEIDDEGDGTTFLSSIQREAINKLTEVLYPDDSSIEGQSLRLKQEYFFVSAGIQLVLNKYLALNLPLYYLPEKVAVHINDTHPALCIPELMRLLLDEHGLAWEEAWKITVKTMSYTNHTIMSEALEKWSVSLVMEQLPRIYHIIYEINRRFIEKEVKRVPYAIIKEATIIQDNYILMAHLAIIGSHSTNGVAKMHSLLLQDKVLHPFYQLYPHRFSNKTNGIAERRWLQLANPTLSSLIDQSIGTTWRYNCQQLHLLTHYQNNAVFLQKLRKVKEINKQILADYIREKAGIVISPKAIFDVQIKRIHAYKRQVLNMLHILSLYLEIKEGNRQLRVPRVFIFGGKAAPSYYYAKVVIKCLNELAALINQDPLCKDQLTVIFLENYNVSLAELVIPAADVSEQISLASKEASGTSNMKLMLNGAVAIATRDGANLEILDRVGDDNMYVFGLTQSEVYEYYDKQYYNSGQLYEENDHLQQLLNCFVDGTIPNIEAEGKEVYDSLIRYNDEYFILKDYSDYHEKQLMLERAYQDEMGWTRKSLINIANGGFFSSDETIHQYAEEIWHLRPMTKRSL